MTVFVSSGYDPAQQGCRFLVGTGRICDDQDTVTVDGVNGRRCAAHPPEYLPLHRARLLHAGDVTSADAYLETWLHIEAGPGEAAA